MNFRALTYNIHHLFTRICYTTVNNITSGDADARTCHRARDTAACNYILSGQNGQCGSSYRRDYDLFVE